MASPWERRLPWIAGAFLAVPILIVRYPPMGDLPMHEALVAIMRHRNDPAWAPPGMYRLVVPQANQLFHVLAYALSFAMPTDVACKVLVAAAVASAPPAMARLLGRLRLSRLPSLLVGPIAYGWMFHWGLVANLLGFTLFLFFLPELERLAVRPSRRAALASVVGAAVLFFAHQAAALFYAIVAGYFGVVRPGAIQRRAVRMAPCGALLVLSLAQWQIGRALRGANMESIANNHGLGVTERLEGLPGAVFGGIGSGRLAILGGAWIAAVIATVIANLAANAGRPPRRLALRVALWRYRYAVLSACFFFLYLVFPMALGGTTLLAHRFLPAAFACLVVACAPRASRVFRAARAVRMAAFVLPVALVPILLGVEKKSFAESDRRFRDLDDVLARIPNNVAVAQLDLSPTRVGLVAPVPGAASRVQAEHGGRMLFQMTDMPPNPVYMPRALQWNEPMLRMARAPYALLPSYDAGRFSYLLVHSVTPQYRSLITQALKPEEELVASKGEWDLYRSTVSVVTVDAPDRPMPSPPPETLADRVNRLVREARDAGRSDRVGGG
jgi:hypothetical protein